MRTQENDASRLNCKKGQVLGLALLALVLAVGDLWSAVERPQRSKMAAWASWIGEVPTAAELYSDAASDVPTSEAFDDDDDDEELDASASNENPDSETDADEAYEDADDNDQQESGRQESWLKAPARTPAARVGGHAIWTDLEGWRRNKRDIEDQLVLASRRAARRQRLEGADDQDLDSVDDGDEDAWVHDGVDDIHIDPETKRAASELSYDEKSIDAEYEPHALANRTRITTIAEVIPLAAEPEQSADSSAPASYAEDQPSRGYLLPASMLTLDQVLALHERQQQQRQHQHKRRHLAPTATGVASLSSSRAPTGGAS